MAKRSAKDRVSRLAGGQFGRIARWQLRSLGVADSTISRWVAQGYLHRVLPTVYAVGHAAPSTEADLAAALLYAGPGAMPSHATALWWWGLIEHQPHTIGVSTPRRCRPRPGIEVHQRRPLERTWHERLPVTTVP